MKKWRVSLQFVVELFIVTFLAIVIGTAGGAAASVPVTNSLLLAPYRIILILYLLMNQRETLIVKHKMK